MLCFILASTAIAGGQSRITGDVDDAARVRIPQSRPGFMARAGLMGAQDLGPVDEGTQFDRMTLVLKMSSEQERSLTALLDGQQTKGSANYHRWLTPE